ncbi:MAG TPA: TraB/GumN family protein [Xanthomonadales bacterium]
MPCKKNPIVVLTVLILGLLISCLPVALAADVEPQIDTALFWSIQKSGQTAGYLLGTIHSEDPRVLDFSDDLLDKLRENQVFAMELVPDSYMLERLNGYMNYPPGQRLESVIGAERYHKLEKALSAYRVQTGIIERMKPWAAMMTLSTPPPETGFFMDLSLSLRASGSGLEVMGLESLEEQLSFLENMPMTMQLALLDQAIDESDQVDKVHDQMVDAYLENNLVVLQVLSDEQLEAVSREAGDYFIEYGIHDRNQRMAETLLHQLENKTVFAAVGALHLPGEEGLLNILRQHGYELSPQEMPLRRVPDDQP